MSLEIIQVYEFKTTFPLGVNGYKTESHYSLTEKGRDDSLVKLIKICSKDTKFEIINNPQLAITNNAGKTIFLLGDTYITDKS